MLLKKKKGLLRYLSSFFLFMFAYILNEVMFTLDCVIHCVSNRVVIINTKEPSVIFSYICIMMTISIKQKTS